MKQRQARLVIRNTCSISILAHSAHLLCESWEKVGVAIKKQEVRLCGHTVVVELTLIRGAFLVERSGDFKGTMLMQVKTRRDTRFYFNLAPVTRFFGKRKRELSGV